ncbi:HCP-like protein [Backusella circina FSU 941]|nr:HCP-like protein [Backusella circina FSU 941]
MSEYCNIIKELFTQLETDGITLSDDLIESVNNRDGKALCCIGLIYFSKNEYAKAILWQRLSASNHFSKGQLCLGMAYKMGQGVPVDYHLSMEWFLKAANNSDLDASYNIGELLEQGLGVPTNKKMALEWYHKVSRSSEDVDRLNYQGYYITREDHAKSVTDLIRETEEVLKVEKERRETINKLKNMLIENQKMNTEIRLLQETNTSVKEELRNIKDTMRLLENRNNKLCNSSNQSDKMIELLYQANEKITHLSEKEKREADKKIRYLKKENKDIKQRMDLIESALQRSNIAQNDGLCMIENKGNSEE